jgi:homoserine kinase
LAKPESITFHVPASAANIGPGYGTLAIALDLPMHVTIEARTDGELVVERRDGPTVSADDARHDPVLRGLRAGAEALDVPLQKGLTLLVDGTIPRGTGLGTISARLAAGFGAAARLARKKWTPGMLLDQLVPLGGDPAHGAASLLGGLCVTVPIGAPGDQVRRHQPLQFPIHGNWQFVVVLPDLALGTADSKRVLPPTLPHAVATRTAGRVVGMLTALAQGDEDLLRACLYDETHVPYRRTLYVGLESTLKAGIEAGAAGATICGHGPSLLAMTTDAGRTAAIARAMVDALSRVDRHATSLTLNVAHYGALPLQPDAAP